MSPTARGWLMAIGSIGALVLVVQLTMDPLKKKPPPPPPPPPAPPATIVAVPDAAPVDDGGAAAASLKQCRALENKYRELRESVESCKTDADCTIEAKDPIWPGLDGCIRVGKGKGTNGPASDAVAREWSEKHCADPRDTTDRCPKAPKVRCANGRCGEKPPAPLPPDWHRFAIRHVLRTFVPPDLVPRVEDPARAPGTIFSDLDGDGRSLSIALNKGRKLTAKSVVDLDLGMILTTQKAVRIDGHPSTVFLLGAPATTANGPDLATGGFFARAGLDDLEAGDLGSAMHLDFFMRCTKKESCEALATILAHTDLLLPAPRDH